MAAHVGFVAITFALTVTGSLAVPPLCSSSGRIVGGYAVNITDVPFQVSLQNDLGHFCGGSIISSRWILTAGHCVGSTDRSMLKVRFGSSLSNEGGQLLTLKRVVQHPQFNSDTIDYDFGLLELSEELKLNNRFYAVELPERDEPFPDGTCLRVSGWGDTQNASENGYQLKAANIPVVNQDKCSETYDFFVEVTPRMICAGYDIGSDNACHRDSGGPLVDGSKLVGVVSWGYACAAKGYPAVYARMAAVRDWVKEVSGV